MKGFLRGCNRLALAMYMLFAAFLAYLSFYYVAETNFRTFKEEPFLLANNPLMMIVGVAVLTCVLWGVSYVFDKARNKKLVLRVVIAAVVLIHVALSIIWIRANHAYPAGDQYIVWSKAVELAGGRNEIGIEYFTDYPFQAGMLFLMKALVEITGITEPVVYRALNVPFVALIDLGIICISGEMVSERKEISRLISALMVFLFAPVFIYVTYVYGTTIAMALAIWAFYGVIRCFNTGDIRWGIVTVVLLPLANRLYGGTTIATIAVILALLFEALTKKRVAFLMLVLLIGVTYIGSGKALRRWYYNETGIEESVKGVSTAALVLMGMTSEDGVAGPGSYNGMHVRFLKIYADEATSVAIKDSIKVAGEYLTGERNPRFFFEKTIYQWMDPYFGAITMTCNSMSMLYEQTEEFLSFMRGGVPDAYGKYVLKYLMAFVYFFGLVGGIFIIRKKDYSSAKLMLFTYFIGGFVFQFFWEGKARYCMPYFVCLFPLAVYGLVGVMEMVPEFKFDPKDKRRWAVLLGEALVVGLVTTFQAFAGSFDTEVDEFYSDYDDEQMYYADASFDDEHRAIHSDYVVLNRGIYFINFDYASDLPADAVYGGKIYLNSRPGETVFYRKTKYEPLDESGHTSFGIEVPFNNTAVQVRMALDGGSELVLPGDRAGYFLAENVKIHENVGMSIAYRFIFWAALLLLLDLLLVVILAPMPVKESDLEVC